MKRLSALNASPLSKTLGVLLVLGLAIGCGRKEEPPIIDVPDTDLTDVLNDVEDGDVGVPDADDPDTTQTPDAEEDTGGEADVEEDTGPDADPFVDYCADALDAADIAEGSYLVSVELPIHTESLLFELEITREEGESTFAFALTSLSSDRGFDGELRDERRVPLQDDSIIVTGVSIEADGTFSVTFENLPASDETAPYLLDEAQNPFSLILEGYACTAGNLCGDGTVYVPHVDTTIAGTFAGITFETDAILDAPVVRSCDVLNIFLNDPDGELPAPQLPEPSPLPARDTFTGLCAEGPTTLEDIERSFFVAAAMPFTDEPLLLQVDIEPEEGGTYKATVQPLRLDIRNYGDPVEWDQRRTAVGEPTVLEGLTIDADGTFTLAVEDQEIHRDANPIARYEARGSLTLSAMFCGDLHVCGIVTDGELTYPVALPLGSTEMTMGGTTYEDILDAPALTNCAEVDAFEIPSTED